MSKSRFHLKSNHVCTYEPDIWQCDRVNVTYDGAMTDAVVERYWNREREREINEYGGHIPQGRCSCPSIWNRCWAGGGRMPRARHVPEKSSVQMPLPGSCWCQLPLTLSMILRPCEPSGNDGKNRPVLLRSRQQTQAPTLGRSRHYADWRKWHAALDLHKQRIHLWHM